VVASRQTARAGIVIAGHDPRYRHLEVEVILAARGASRRRRREAAREGFDQKPSVGVEGGRLTDAVAHRRVGDRIGTATADLDLLRALAGSWMRG
jgi:hypothetical protein